jgi:hypothetical protein
MEEIIKIVHDNGIVLKGRVFITTRRKIGEDDITYYHFIGEIRNSQNESEDMSRFNLSGDELDDFINHLIDEPNTETELQTLKANGKWHKVIYTTGNGTYGVRK